MNFNFELILFYAILITGFISLVDLLFLAGKRKQIEKMSGKAKLPILIDYSRSFFPILLIVFALRSFLFEPFRIPSASLEPTLLTGDFILVNKFHYGLRLPVIHKKVLEINQPKRGDIMVFRWPPNPSINFIKRVIGLPGDHISYINRELLINGEKIPQTWLENVKIKDESGVIWDALKKQESLFNVKHDIYLIPAKESRDYHEIIVPEGMYFVMGDNRDDSADSRYWGLVPESNIIGKASLVWLSWNNEKTMLRFDRIGSIIK